MKEYECEEYVILNSSIKYYMSNVIHIPINTNHATNDILDIIIEKSTLINKKLLEDNERLTLKMIEIENATKGYFKKIEEVIN